MTTFDTNLTFEDMPGEVELDERREKKHEPGSTVSNPEYPEFRSYNSDSLVDTETNKLVLRLNFCPLRGAVHLEMLVHHITDDDTDRVFHANLEAHLNGGQVRQIRDYLSFLLAVDGR